MKFFSRLLALCLVSGLTAPAHAEDPVPSTPAAESAVASEPTESPAVTELNALVAAITTKLRSGVQDPAKFADETAAFDVLLAKYAPSKSEDAASIAFMRATYFSQVLEDEDTALTALAALQIDFPESAAAANADKAIDQINKSRAAHELQTHLVGQPAPEIHFNWSTRDGLHLLSDLQGKVVLLDFWATWCGPCVASFPNIRELAADYASSDVVVVGVTSIQGMVRGLTPDRIDTRGDPDREKSLMTDYIKAKDITWTVAFSDEAVFNENYGVTGIPHMVIIAPDGTVRHTGLHPSMPHPEKTALINAILTEFKLPIPAAPAS